MTARGMADARGGRAWWFAAPVLLLLIPFLLWPLGSMLWRGLTPDGALSASALADVVRDRYYWERLGFTAGQAAASTALSVLVGVPAAYVFALVRFPLRGLALALVTVPFVLPTLVVALAFQQLLGPNGWVNDALEVAGFGPVEPIGTIWAILLAHVFFNVAIVIRLVAGVWTNLDPATGEAARTLGAGRVAAFRHVTLPALAPALAAAAALVFMFTFTSFGVVLVLGGPGLDTLEVVIYRLTTRLVALEAAAVLSILQIIATGAALIAYALLQRHASRPVTQRTDRARGWRRLGSGERALVVGVAAVLMLLLAAPLAALVHGAFTVGASGAATGENFARLFEDTGRVSFIEPANAIRWSLVFALTATAIAVPAGLLVALALARARGRLGGIADGLLMLPLAVPAVVLGFGYLTTFNRDPFDLRGGPWLVIAAHSLIAYPFVVRAALAVTRSLDPRLGEAARVLGASPLRAWRYIELPLSLRALLVGAIFAFAISLGEFGATVTVQSREYATMPVAIFDALGRPGAANLGRALALSTLLMAVTAASFLLIERLRYRDLGGF